MGRTYETVQEMLDDCAAKELADHYRQHNKKWSVRLRRWWQIRKAIKASQQDSPDAH
jgi:hypothetical protein